MHCSRIPISNLCMWKKKYKIILVSSSFEFSYIEILCYKNKLKKTTKFKNHLAWKARGASSDNGVATGVVIGDGAGEFRHKGHVALIFSHSSTHSAWKQCWQSGTQRIVSFGR